MCTHGCGAGHRAGEGPLRRHLEIEPRQEQVQPRSGSEELNVDIRGCRKGLQGLREERTGDWSGAGVVYTSNLDGQDVPISGNNPNADTVSAKRIDANTLEIVNKKNGKVTTTQKNVVAADGKTRTVTTTGTDGQGQKVNNVAVYEKQ